MVAGPYRPSPLRAGAAGRIGRPRHAFPPADRVDWTGIREGNAIALASLVHPASRTCAHRPLFHPASRTCAAPPIGQTPRVAPEVPVGAGRHWSGPAEVAVPHWLQD